MKGITLALAFVAVGCVGAAPSSESPSAEEVLALIQLGDEQSIEHAVSIGAQLSEEEAGRLVLFASAVARDRTGAEPALRFVANNSIPVAWSVWPSGRLPYEATARSGVCGADTDLVARYAGVAFANVGQLRLRTNNAVTYAVAAVHGLRLSAYEINPSAGRVSVCAGLGRLAGFPVVRNQLASLFLSSS